MVIGCWESYSGRFCIYVYINIINWILLDEEEGGGKRNERI